MLEDLIPWLFSHNSVQILFAVTGSCVLNQHKLYEHICESEKVIILLIILVDIC